VWVVRFQLERRRFLVAHHNVTSAPEDSDEARGYTASAAGGLRDERQVLEPVGPKWNQKLALQRQVSWAKERRVISDAIDRLMEDPHMRAELKGELRVMRRRLAAIDRRLYGIAA
jgi:hypothetical protein